MKKNIKRKDLVGLNNTFAALKDVKNKWFQHGIKLNQLRIQEEIQAINDLYDFSDKYKEYEKKRQEIISPLCEKNQTGQPLIMQGRYVFSPENQTIFNEKHTALFEEYKESIEEANKLIEEINDILDTEIEIDFVPIDFNIIPEEIDGDLFDNIYILITNFPESIPEGK